MFHIKRRFLRKPTPPTIPEGAISDQTLESGNLRNAVVLPEGENEHEWIAFNIWDFHKQINMLYGTVLPHCTAHRCELMNAGRMYKYYWSDSSSRRPQALPAPNYIDNLMTWVSELLDNEAIFPTRQEGKFPDDIRNICGKIFRRLFRVYAHIYICHMDDIRRLQEEAHLNTSFKHFIYFVQEFQLISKNELAPLQKVIDVLITK